MCSGDILTKSASINYIEEVGECGTKGRQEVRKEKKKKKKCSEITKGNTQCCQKEVGVQ